MSFSQNNETKYKTLEVLTCDVITFETKLNKTKKGFVEKTTKH
jgi:hypothetical protein